MPGTLFDPARRAEVRERLARLRPDAPAQFGRLDAPRMVTHLIQFMRVALGEEPCAPRGPAILAMPGIREFVVHWMPWPKGAPTAPELLSRVPASWGDDVATLTSLVERFPSHPDAASWPRHPAFGALSGASWGVLAYRHLDHHLTQFGA